MLGNFSSLCNFVAKNDVSYMFDSFKTLKQDLEAKKLQNYNFHWVLSCLVKT